MESSLAQDSGKTAGRDPRGSHREQNQQSGHEYLWMAKMSLEYYTGLYVSFVDVAASVSCGPLLIPFAEGSYSTPKGMIQC